LYDGWYEGNGSGLLAFHGIDNYEIRGALEFDFRVLPSSATINTATLFLTTDPGHGGVSLVQLQVEGYSGNGVVELSDMSAFNRVATVTYAPEEVARVGLALDVTAFAQTLHSVDAGWAGFTFHTTPGVTIGVAGTDTSQVHWRPRLEVEFSNAMVPEPHTVSLVIVGLLILITCFISYLIHRHLRRKNVS
jgi:hypothetical protein